MVMPGLALRSTAMCFRAWIAYCCPGPGSSDAMRLMAACASVKIVTCASGDLLTIYASPDSANPETNSQPQEMPTISPPNNRTLR